MNLEQRVQWLVDRAAISDLLCSFARALDTRDWATYAANYAEDGVLELPDPQGGAPIVLRSGELRDAVPRSLGRYRATQHLSCNHQIEIDGERARSRSYLLAMHVGHGPREQWSAGGWYDCEYIRTDAGWKFRRVGLSVVWLDGEPGAIRPE